MRKYAFFSLGWVEFLNVRILAFSNICPSILTDLCEILWRYKPASDFNHGKVSFFFALLRLVRVKTRYFSSISNPLKTEKKRLSRPVGHFGSKRLYLRPANSSNGVYLFLKTFIETIRVSPCAPQSAWIVLKNPSHFDNICTLTLCIVHFISFFFYVSWHFGFFLFSHVSALWSSYSNILSRSLKVWPKCRKLSNFVDGGGVLPGCLGGKGRGLWL